MEMAQLHLEKAKVEIRYGEYEEALKLLRKVRQFKCVEETVYLPWTMKAVILGGIHIEQGEITMPNLEPWHRRDPLVVEFFVGEGLREVAEGKVDFLK